MVSRSGGNFGSEATDGTTLQTLGAPYETKGVAERYMLAIRLERPYAELIGKLLERHDVRQFSKYLRGLIYADATRSGLPVTGLDVPGWLSRSCPELFATAGKPKRKAARAFQQKRGRGRRQT